MEHVAYVFCHGLNGCGQYDREYQKRPYWGGRSGDVIAGLKGKGYAAHAASVAPQGSAWDRACELFAQIAGTRTDYGMAHAAMYRHERFGPDFTDRQLIASWDDDTRLVLIGHSFGGATVRLLTELLANGSEEERAATDGGEISPLFAGGMEGRVRAVVTLAAPHNGTTAYELGADPAFDARDVKVSVKSRVLDRLVKARTKIKGDGRDVRDWANFDMALDNAQALNERISTLPNVYYLSLACDATIEGEGGIRVPDPDAMEPLFEKSATLMGCYSGKTGAGCVVDDAWHANDGLVNTVSARAPFGAPQKPLDTEHVERGVWNVMPDRHVHHAYFQGGFFKRCDPYPFFEHLMELTSALG